MYWISVAACFQRIKDILRALLKLQGKQAIENDGLMIFQILNSILKLGLGQKTLNSSLELSRIEY